MKKRRIKKLLNNLKQTIPQGAIAATTLPLCPDISLFLLREDYPRGRLEDKQMMLIMDNPAYWAFCWASGQVLGGYILAHPEEVAGKAILDFGSGSGIVAIAAKLAGASRAIACDIDQHALDAVNANADLNNVEVELLSDISLLERPIDMIIAADVLYDRDNFSWISRLPDLADDILIADSRIKADALMGYSIIHEATSTTMPDLDEYQQFNQVRIYRWSPQK